MASPKRAGPGGHRDRAAIVVLVLTALGGQVATAFARATHAFGG